MKMLLQHHRCYESFVHFESFDVSTVNIFDMNCDLVLTSLNSVIFLYALVPFDPTNMWLLNACSRTALIQIVNVTVFVPGTSPVFCNRHRPKLSFICLQYASVIWSLSFTI